MAQSLYKHIREAWKNPGEGDLGEVQWSRLQRWRKQGAMEKIDRPTRLDKARSLGYKAKQGIVLLRVRIKRSSSRKTRPNKGRKSKRMGTRRVTRAKNKQWIAEERASRKHPNLRVLNSYWVGDDGKHKWFEVILLDPDHPSIKNDSDLNWITDDSQKNRVFRGKTKAGRKTRGLATKGKGTEKTR